MRKYPRKKTKGKTKKKKKKKKKNKLVKFQWDSISGRRFGNQTLYPLDHHRQHAYDLDLKDVLSLWHKFELKMLFYNKVWT